MTDPAIEAAFRQVQREQERARYLRNREVILMRMRAYYRANKDKWAKYKRKNPAPPAQSGPETPAIRLSPPGGAGGRCLKEEG